MLKASLKYLLIAITNLVILIVLLELWTDRFELLFHNVVRLVEFFKILCFTTFSLIGMRILAYFFKKRNIRNARIKLISAIILTVSISSYLYVDYSIKLVKNVIINGRFRNGIANKIEPSIELSSGTRAAHLTIKEYEEITRMNWFPKIPVNATDISYDYGYDGFLPDYIFSLSYYLPKETKVDTINYANGEFSKYQTFQLIGDKKRVTYKEIEQ